MDRPDERRADFGKTAEFRRVQRARSDGQQGVFGGAEVRDRRRQFAILFVQLEVSEYVAVENRPRTAINLCLLSLLSIYRFFYFIYSNWIRLKRV